MTQSSNKSEKPDIIRKLGRKAVISENSAGKRVQDALGERSQAWLAEKSKVPGSTVNDVIKNGAIVKTDTLLALADALDVDPGWLLTGRAPTDGADGMNLVAIDEVDLAYGLGGTFADGPVTTERHYFQRSWLEGITRTPAAMLTFARGRGDSMQPTLNDGDMVLVDRSQRAVREQDAIWALTVGDIAMIKRLRFRSETVIILSDNDRVPPDEAHVGEINIVGRVIFIGRKY
ncbi:MULTISPECIES: XRE family transcriptional regulator [unclassified Sphingomonas]|uniref:XRE family transcriptional regulator n=1 Tax=unclassified Sphingomonas TaxID=196159 RepID=UPI0018D24B64|nr:MULTISPECIES: S24 family peptidase [unclassified Sphingomonas]